MLIEVPPRNTSLTLLSSLSHSIPNTLINGRDPKFERHNPPSPVLELLSAALSSTNALVLAFIPLPLLLPPSKELLFLINWEDNKNNTAN